MFLTLECEMEEETGLKVSYIVYFVDIYEFRTIWYIGFKKCQRFVFVVEIEDFDIM